MHLILQRICSYCLNVMDRLFIFRNCFISCSLKFFLLSLFTFISVNEKAFFLNFNKTLPNFSNFFSLESVCQGKFLPLKYIFQLFTLTRIICFFLDVLISEQLILLQIFNTFLSFSKFIHLFNGSFSFVFICLMVSYQKSSNTDFHQAKFALFSINECK